MDAAAVLVTTGEVIHVEVAEDATVGALKEVLADAFGLDCDPCSIVLTVRGADSALADDGELVGDSSALAEGGTLEVTLEAAIKAPRTYHGHIGWVRHICLSSDGTLMASTSSDTVRVWDTTTAQEVKTIEDDEGGACGGFTSCAFSADQSLLYVLASELQVWGTEGWQLQRTLDGPWHTFATSQNVERLYLCNFDALAVWDARTLQPSTSLDCSAVNVAESPSGTRLYAAGDRHLLAWDTESWSLVASSDMQWGSFVVAGSCICAVRALPVQLRVPETQGLVYVLDSESLVLQRTFAAYPAPLVPGRVACLALSHCRSHLYCPGGPTTVFDCGAGFSFEGVLTSDPQCMAVATWGRAVFHGAAQAVEVTPVGQLECCAPRPPPRRAAAAQQGNSGSSKKSSKAEKEQKKRGRCKQPCAVS